MYESSSALFGFIRYICSLLHVLRSVCIHLPYKLEVNIISKTNLLFYQCFSVAPSYIWTKSLHGPGTLWVGSYSSGKTKRCPSCVYRFASPYWQHPQYLESAIRDNIRIKSINPKITYCNFYLTRCFAQMYILQCVLHNEEIVKYYTFK